MKKKKIYMLIAAIAVIGIVSIAQTNVLQNLISPGSNLSVPVPEKIVSSNDDYFMSPVWSPDGKYIAYSGSNYKGIYIKDLSTNNVKQLTSEEGAGYGFEWSYDSKAILCRVSKYEGVRRYNAVKLFFVESSQEKSLTEYKTSMPALPHWTANGEKAYLFDGKNLDVFETGIPANPLNKKSAPSEIVYSKGSKIYVGENSSEKFNSFEALKDQEYINMTTSPDGSKIAFEVYGGNLYIINSDGNNLIDLGKGNRPRWSYDSQRLIYMVTEDDGENFTSSDIFTVKADGSNKIQLTDTDNVIEMDPSWSPDRKHIAYQEMNEGAIYILSVDIP